MKRIIFCFALVFAVCAARGGDKQTQTKPLVIHEWGTFTSLQDEQGNAIGGINTDDEPVPAFVHRLSPHLLIDVNNLQEEEYQGAPPAHPDVTMRLETPVMYFYPPKGWKPHPAPLSVHVSFVGGWLTEFYPAAVATAPGLDAQEPQRVYPERWDPGKEGGPHVGFLTDYTRGDLRWIGLTLNAAGEGPKTDAKVWLAPRAVKSAMVKNDIGERERFLFYRGVAHADAWLQVARDPLNGMLEIRNRRFSPATDDAAKQVALMNRIRAAWLLDVRPGGACAYREIGAMACDKQIIATTTPAFAAEDYSTNNMAKLRAEMHGALVKAGLFPDEAEALLNTWQVSYFKSPGLRLFYICPRQEVDEHLPLEISEDAYVERVMVGRIELVTPEQRALLAKIAAGPAPDMSEARAEMEKKGSDFFAHPENAANWEDVMTGKKPFSALGMAIPEVYADYLKLGRFRNALALNEQALRPTAALNDFIAKNRLEAYKAAPQNGGQAQNQTGANP